MKLPKITIGQKPTYQKVGEDIDIFALFQKIEQEFSTCFLFESLGEEGKFSRYTIIGFDPAHIISGRGKNITIDGQSFSVANPYESLREIMPQKAIARNYAGGLVGYLSYEAVNYFEPALDIKVHDKFDPFLFGVYTDGVIFDKVTNELFYFYYDVDRREMLQKVMQKKVKKQQLAVKLIGDTVTKEEHALVVEKVQEQIRAGNTF